MTTPENDCPGDVRCGESSYFFRCDDNNGITVFEAEAGRNYFIEMSSTAENVGLKHQEKKP